MTHLDHIQYAVNFGRTKDTVWLSKMMSIYMDHHSYWIAQEYTYDGT